MCVALVLAANAGLRSSARASKNEALEVLAAASLSEAFTEMGHQAERDHPGLSIRFNFAGSQQLATQIEQGIRADVFASADSRWMNHVADRGLLDGEPRVFARNRLVVIVPSTNPARIKRLQDLARGGVKLVLGTESVPVGNYSRTLLRNLSADSTFGVDFAARTLRNVVSEEENVKSIVSKVQLGEADAGIVYRSDVTSGVARFVHVIEVPDNANVIASYPIATVRGSHDPNAAAAFVNLVLSPRGQEILRRHGLLSVTSPSP